MTEREWYVAQDRETIIEWAEERSANAARVIGIHPDVEDPQTEITEGALRLQFLGYASEEALEPITWDAFFEIFEQEGYTFYFREIDEDGNPGNDYVIE